MEQTLPCGYSTPTYNGSSPSGFGRLFPELIRDHRSSRFSPKVQKPATEIYVHRSRGASMTTPPPRPIDNFSQRPNYIWDLIGR
jgi:hypothetical protein